MRWTKKIYEFKQNVVFTNRNSTQQSYETNTLDEHQNICEEISERYLAKTIKNKTDHCLSTITIIVNIAKHKMFPFKRNTVPEQLLSRTMKKEILTKPENTPRRKKFNPGKIKIYILHSQGKPPSQKELKYSATSII